MNECGLARRPFQALLARGGELTGDSSIEQISHVYGRQAVVVSVDPRRVSENYYGDTVPHCL